MKYFNNRYKSFVMEHFVYYEKMNLKGNNHGSKLLSGHFGGKMSSGHFGDKINDSVEVKQNCPNFIKF